MGYNAKTNWSRNDNVTEHDFNRIESGIETIDNGGMKDNSIGSAKLKTTYQSDRIKLVNLNEEVIEAIAGDTAVNQVPADGAVTIEKFAPQLQSMFIEEGSAW